MVVVHCVSWKDVIRAQGVRVGIVGHTATNQMCVRLVDVVTSTGGQASAVYMVVVEVVLLLVVRIKQRVMGSVHNMEGVHGVRYAMTMIQRCVASSRSVHPLDVMQ